MLCGLRFNDRDQLDQDPSLVLASDLASELNANGHLEDDRGSASGRFILVAELGLTHS